MFNPSRSPVLFCITLSALTACNFEYAKSASSTDPRSVIPQAEVPSFETVYLKVFEPNCMECHAARKKPILTSYEAIVANIEDIDQAVFVKRSMPRKRVLSEELLSMLRTWIDAGTPRFGSDSFKKGRDDVPVLGASPSPGSSPPPLGGASLPRPFTYANLKAGVLDKKCMDCHATGNQDGTTPLDTYASTLSVREWIIPLTMGMEGGETIAAEDRMPPPPPEAEPLTDEEMAMILLWFADGNRDENGVIAPPLKPRPSGSPLPASSAEGHP